MWWTTHPYDWAGFGLGACSNASIKEYGDGASITFIAHYYVCARGSHYVDTCWVPFLCFLSRVSLIRYGLLPFLLLWALFICRLKCSSSQLEMPGDSWYALSPFYSFVAAVGQPTSTQVLGERDSHDDVESAQEFLQFCALRGCPCGPAISLDNRAIYQGISRPEPSWNPRGIKNHDFGNWLMSK